MLAPSPSRHQTDRADQARARILDAAMHEFSANGLAGARTERIAEAAGVNKALLYYYFHGKDALYAEALESVAARMAATNMSVLNLDCSAGERLLRTTLNHFDRIYSQPVFQTLLQQEMIRLRKGEATALSPLIEKLFKPMGDRMVAVAEEGIRAGELIPVESSQLIYAMLGPNVFYFLSAPMMRLIADFAPFDPSALAFRRKATLEFLGHAIFADRSYGAQIAARVLADTPMPPLHPPADSPFPPSEKKQRDRRTPAGPNIQPAETSADEVRHK